MTQERKSLESGDIVSALTECEEQVDQLKRENRLLRDASRTFGALAERLNASLAAERRLGRERRTTPRPSPDRRQPAALGETKSR